MGKVVKDTVALSCRLSCQLLDEMDGYVFSDSRFATRTEFVLFCVKLAYGEITDAISYAFSDIGKADWSPDRILVSSLADSRIKMDEILAHMDVYGDETTVVQIRVSRDFMDDIDLLCSLISIKRIDFLKFSVFSYMLNHSGYRIGPADDRGGLSMPRGHAESDPEWESATRDSVKEELRSRMGMKRNRSPGRA